MAGKPRLDPTQRNLLSVMYQQTAMDATEILDTITTCAMLKPESHFIAQGFSTGVCNFADSAQQNIIYFCRLLFALRSFTVIIANKMIVLQ
jgi:hypothetical protein